MNVVLITRHLKMGIYVPIAYTCYLQFLGNWPMCGSKCKIFVKEEFSFLSRFSWIFIYVVASGRIFSELYSNAIDSLFLRNWWNVALWFNGVEFFFICLPMEWCVHFASANNYIEWGGRVERFDVFEENFFKQWNEECFIQGTHQSYRRSCEN